MRDLVLRRRALAAILRRDLRMFLSYRFRFLSQVLSAIFSLALFYYVARLVQVDRFPSPDDYVAFVLVGILTLRLMTATLAQPPQSLLGELRAGTFERLAVSPAGPVTTLVATLVFPFLQAVAVGGVTLVLAAVLFGVDIAFPSALLGLPILVLAGLAFAPFAVAVCAVVLVFKQATSTTGFVVAAVSLVSGLYFPVELLPAWLEWLSYVQPFTPAVDLLRAVLVDQPSDTEAWVDVLRLCAFAVVLLPLALAALHRAVALTRRRGTLTES